MRPAQRPAAPAPPARPPSGAAPALLAALAACALLAAARPAAAAARAVDLDVRWDSSARTVSGTARWTLTNDTDAPLTALPLLLYANRFAAAPAWLSGLTWFQVYPGGVDRGGTTLTAARIGETGETGATALDLPAAAVLAGAGGAAAPLRIDLPLPAPLPAGAPLTLTLAFETRVPSRFGPFGVAGDVLTLEAGWYPVLLALTPAGPADPGPPPPALATVRLACAASADAVIGGVFRRCSPTPPDRRLDLGLAAAVSLQVRPSAARLRTAAAGTRVDLVYGPPRRAAPVPLPARRDGRDPWNGAPAWPRLPELGWVDREGETLRTASDALRFLSEHLPPAVAARLRPSRLRLVEAPLRRDLALPSAGVVFVSDRLLRLTPVERFRQFHRFALVRAVYAQVVGDALGAREAPADRAWVAEVVAEHLTRAFIVARYGVREDAFDVLAPGAFLEAVDNVLYAPQMPFQSAYFNVVDDTDPGRDRWRLFHGAGPTGRRVYEKLRDRLGPPGLDALVTAWLADGQSLRETEGAPPAAFFSAWLGPYPPSNVRLAGVASRRLPPAAAAGGSHYEHAALVVRAGAPPPAAAPPAEPVTVRFLLADGTCEDVVWEAPAGPAEGRVTLRSAHALDTVVLDPEGRLVQWLPGVPDDLRLDDRVSADLKVLLGRVFLTTTPTSGDFSASAEIVLQRRFDIRNRFGLLPFVVPGKIGASVFHSYGFGPRITANRLGAFVSSAVRGAAVETGDGDWRAGLTAQLGVGWSDLVTPFDMMDQTVAFAVLRYLLGPEAGDTRHGGQLDLEGAFVRSVHPRHRFAWRAALGTTVGEVVAGERFRLGGVGGVRALTATERPGRHRGVASLEYRHTFTRSWSVGVARLAWWEGLEGALFVDGGFAADAWADLGLADTWVLGVGYGLRFHATLFGVQPALLSLDLAWPVPTSAALRERTGPPFGVHVYFTQNF
jgi:hypothetical protein